MRIFENHGRITERLCGCFVYGLKYANTNMLEGT